MNPRVNSATRQLLDRNDQYRMADGLSLMTIDKQRNNHELFFAWLHAQGIESAEQVTKACFEQYKVYLCRYISPKTHAQLNATTRRKRAADIRTLFKELAYTGLITEDPLVSARIPKAPRPVVTAFLSEEEIEWLMYQTRPYGLTGLRDRAILECYYGTAARRMEAGKLQLQDVRTDSDKCAILVRKGKGGKGRYTPLYPRTVSWLNAYLNFARPKLAKLNSGTHFFLDNQGKPFNASQLSRLVKKYLLMAGFDVGAACNVLRHSAATHLLQHGADVRCIQEYLGHADISTTQVYLSVTQVQLRETLSRCHPAARSQAVADSKLHDYVREDV
ncbi:tyrosine-type recombinase/integrase [Pseudoalteromonas rubra]|uniref:tyrosine-type recombinase/integrase n=1 Tax=Pseudoalteromonas rubra TaxID=43658 RepID=UPI000696A00C|nr:tyrosine-type recombinase/integrase [Pseudoalteromonas rubra]